MDTKIDFLYLSEPDMIRAGVKDMKQCVEVMEDLLITLNKGDYVMGGKNHNSHGCMIMFPDDPPFPGMPKNADERRFMAMPFEQLVVGNRDAVDDERSLRVEWFAGRHVAAHEGHQLFVVETLQTGPLAASVGA